VRPRSPFVRNYRDADTAISVARVISTAAKRVSAREIHPRWNLSRKTHGTERENNILRISTSSRLSPDVRSTKRIKLPLHSSAVLYTLSFDTKRCVRRDDIPLDYNRLSQSSRGDGLKKSHR